MGRENDRIDARIACLRIERMPATLISSDGYHCDVWRSVGSVRRGRGRESLDLVVKVPRTPVPPAEVRALQREHRQLRARLGDMVPATRFVVTRIDGAASVVALAQTASRWFDVANPAHEAEARPLFRLLRRAREDLRTFIAAADAWYAEEERVIDLYGLDNLVLDRHQRLRYIDSFGVFFHGDLLHALPDPDPGLAERIEVSRRRLEYLRDLLAD